MAPAVASVAVKGPVAFSCSRCSHLDSGHYFFELVVPQLSLVSLPEPFAPGGLDWDGALVMRQSTVAIGRISCPLCMRCSHLEFGALFPCPCLWLSMFRVSGCC